MTYVTGTMKLYVNGTLAGTQTGVALPVSSTSALRIGNTKVGAGLQFAGLIDDVRVYDRALSAAQIAADQPTAVEGPIAPAATGPIAHLTFDELSGPSAADVTGRGHNGTLSGGATLGSAGRHGGAVSFSGTTATVTVPDADELDLSSLTIEAWIAPATAHPWQVVLWKELPGSIAYGLLAAGAAMQPNAWIGSQSATATATIAAGAWRHLAMTYDSGELKVYVDGVPAATQTGVAPPLASTGALRIGNTTAASGVQFTGRVDDVRIYDRPLSAAEISADM
jgi:hypothetical protein